MKSDLLVTLGIVMFGVSSALMMSCELNFTMTAVLSATMTSGMLLAVYNIKNK